MTRLAHPTKTVKLPKPRTAATKEQRLDPMILLARGMMHKLNNLLVPSTIYPALLLDDLPADSPARANLTEMLDAAVAASQLMRELQQVVKCGAGMDCETTPLAGILEQLNDSVEVRALRARHASVRIDLLPPAPDLRAQVSQPHLQRAMHVLLRQQLRLAVPNTVVTIGAGHIQIRDPSSWDPILSPGEYCYLQIKQPTGRHPRLDDADSDKIMELERDLAFGIFRDHGGSLRVRVDEFGSTMTGYLPLAH